MRRYLVTFIVLMSIVALALSACAPKATEPVVEATEAPTEAVVEVVTEEATEAPTEEPVAEVVALSGKVTLAGSTTVQPLAEELAEAFMDLNPDVEIEVQGGGSSVGVTSVVEGTADIGNLSREVKESELTENPNMIVNVIAFDGIAIVTNPELELPSLTVDQIRMIFSGEITNYAEVGGPDAPIIVVSREEGSGTRGAFEELVMLYKDANGEKQTAQIAENAVLQQSNGQVRTTVAETPNTIAYLSFGFLDDSINTVMVDDVEPTVEHVKDGTYTIFRPLVMVTNGEATEVAQAFLDFILSDAGQAMVAEQYITVE